MPGGSFYYERCYSKLPPGGNLLYSNFPPLENSVSACVYVVYHIMCQQHTEHRVMRYLADFVLVRDQVMAA